MKQKILIIEDTKQTQRWYKTILDYEYELKFVDNLTDARRSVESESFYLVITDGAYPLNPDGEKRINEDINFFNSGLKFLEFYISQLKKNNIILASTSNNIVQEAIFKGFKAYSKFYFEDHKKLEEVVKQYGIYQNNTLKNPE
jgi:DNA-binding NtrC family response regulator